jgi:hypothetical protein
MPVAWAPGERGIGSLLMVMPGLTRRDDGHPYQALFVFDERSRPTRLVTNGTRAPQGWHPDHPADLDQLVALPDDVAAAAQRWFDEHSGTGGASPCELPN